MKNIFILLVFSFLLIATLIIFIASCIITLSDGQGALVFIFSIPIMAALLFCAFLLAQRTKINEKIPFHIDIAPKIISLFIVLFFLLSFIPILQKAPQTFLSLVEKSFVLATGKTPYLYMRERSSFPNKLSLELKKPNLQVIAFSDIGVTFAWDRVCIFGPYTNNEKAKSILKLNWNIEDHSQIHFSDSINALVFLYQSNVNHVIDLKRGLIDFKELDFCLDRSQTNFKIDNGANGSKVLVLENKN